MRRTIHSDPSREQRKSRGRTKKVLPSNFQFGLETKGEELRVRRSSDGRVEQMVEVEQYNQLNSDFTSAQDQLTVANEKIDSLTTALEELAELVQTLLP